MTKIALAFVILGTTLATALYTAPAHAQATRTWVSGVGDDANPCSRTAPCKTWAGAFGKTLPGGEIDALDPGGFGTLTITGSITIDGGGGQVASTLASGTNGFTIAAAANGYVIIRNVRFNGLSSAGLNNGISYNSGAQVTVDNCDISAFLVSGINVSLGGNVGVLEVRNTTFRNNGTGLIAAASSGGIAVVQVVNSSFVGNNLSGSATQAGVLANANSNVIVANSTFQDLTYGAQVQSGAVLEVDTSLFSTPTGIQTNPGASAYANNNSFYGYGPAFGGSGTVNTANNNKIGANATVGTATVNSSGITIK